MSSWPGPTRTPPPCSTRSKRPSVSSVSRCGPLAPPRSIGARCRSLADPGARPDLDRRARPRARRHYGLDARALVHALRQAYGFRRRALRAGRVRRGIHGRGPSLGACARQSTPSAALPPPARELPGLTRRRRTRPRARGLREALRARARRSGDGLRQRAGELVAPGWRRRSRAGPWGRLNLRPTFWMSGLFYAPVEARTDLVTLETTIVALRAGSDVALLRRGAFRLDAGVGQASTSFTPCPSSRARRSRPSPGPRRCSIPCWRGACEPSSARRADRARSSRWTWTTISRPPVRADRSLRPRLVGARPLARSSGILLGVSIPFVTGASP